MDPDVDGAQAQGQLAALRSRLARAEDDGRRASERSAALTELVHALSGADDPQAVAALVATAIPGLLGADSAAVWLWHAREGEMRAVATAGLEPALHDVLLALPVRPAEAPEVAALLTTRQPLVLQRGSVSPALEDVLVALDLRAAVGVALLSRATLLGAVTASWRSRPAGTDLHEATLRLQGIADHAATAVHNARLVDSARHQALHDALTGLPNRVLFADRLETALAAARRGGGAAVLFCDLDRFKEVNDEHGHLVGDEVLRQVAVRLCDAVRPGDTVARLSGDEFAVLLPDVQHADRAHEVAERVTACFDEPFRVSGLPLRMSVSVGVALRVGEAHVGGSLLQAADTAMYAAKRRGHNQIVAAPSSGGRTGGDAGVGGALQCSDTDELRLFLQAFVRLHSSLEGPDDVEVVGAEALLRWQHARLGLLRPSAFLPLADATGSVVELDLWVVARACQEAAAWSAAEGRPRHVAVNFSVRTLLDPRVVEAVRSALAASGLQPDRLHVEVVESSALLDSSRVVERLVALRHLGVRVSLDDFGTGYSTLSWLQELPVDRIKVDRSIVRDTTAHEPRRRRVATALLRGMVTIGHELDVEVLAEGVETAEQLQAVREAGCSLVQGALFGLPSPSRPGTRTVRAQLLRR